VYWEGYSAQEAYEILRGQFERLRFGDFIQKLARVEERMSGINRAKIRRDFERAGRSRSTPTRTAAARGRVEMAYRRRGRRQAGERRGRLGSETGLPEGASHPAPLRAHRQADRGPDRGQDPMIYCRIERVRLELKRRRSTGADVLLREATPPTSQMPLTSGAILGSP
jgi:hypothetical protein